MFKGRLNFIGMFGSFVLTVCVSEEAQVGETYISDDKIIEEKHCNMRYPSKMNIILIDQACQIIFTVRRETCRCMWTTLTMPCMLEEVLSL